MEEHYENKANKFCWSMQPEGGSHNFISGQETQVEPVDVCLFWKAKVNNCHIQKSLKFPLFYIMMVILNFSKLPLPRLSVWMHWYAD